MSFAESAVWESDDENAYILVTYRVRVCTRCGHAACPCCNGTWCDACFDGADAPEYKVDENDDFKVNAQCADAQECVYDEPDSEAVVEVRREAKTKAEHDAAFARATP